MKKRLAYIILCGILSCIAYLLYINIPDSTKGIDLSHHNPITDKFWNHFKTNNYKFVYLKVSEGGTWKDNKRMKFYNKAKQAYMLVGCYHFFNDNVSAKKQFDNFKNATQGIKMDLIPVIDFERDGYTKQSDFFQRRERLKELNQLFYNEYKVYPIIYCHPWDRLILPVYMDNAIFWTSVRFKSGDILQRQHEYILGTNIDINYINDLSTILLNR